MFVLAVQESPPELSPKNLTQQAMDSISTCNVIVEFFSVFDLIYLAFTINKVPSASRGAHPTNVYIGAISNASDDLNGVAQVR